MSEIGSTNVRLIEEVFCYRFVWALEAIRTRRNILGNGSFNNSISATALIVETGLPHLSMALLIRAGLPSRRAAIEAINDTRDMFDGINRFDDNAGMLEWLRSEEVLELTNLPNWPTPETASVLETISF